MEYFIILFLLILNGLFAMSEIALVSSKRARLEAVSYTHLRAHETVLDLVCRLLLEKKKNTQIVISVVIHLLHN